MSSRKLLYALLCLGCITISFNVAAIAAAIPSISKGLGQPDFLVSRVIPFYMIPYGVGALFYAPLTRRFSYRRILVVTFLVYALASVFCGMATTVRDLFIGRLVAGVSGAAAIPLGLMLIGQLFERNVRGRLVGMFFSLSFVASNAGLILGGMSDWRWLFYVPAGLSILAAISLLALKSEHLRQRNIHAVNYWKALRQVRIRELFIFIFVISALYHGVQQWYGVYLNREYDLDKIGITLFFVWMSLASIAGQMWGGWLADKKSRRLACFWGILLLGLSTVSLLAHWPLGVLAVLLATFASGWTVGHNGVSTVITDLPDEHRAETASLNSAVRFVSGGAGFILSSPFVQFSFGWTFFGFGILMLGCLVFLRKVIPE